MTNYLITLLALVALTCQAQGTVEFGSALRSGYVRPSSWIREAKTTLVLPAVANPVAIVTALWPGMETSGGDLIQALAISTSEAHQ